jgi:hypothetical protein
MPQFINESGYYSAYTSAASQYLAGVTIQAVQQLAIAGIQLAAQQYIADKQYAIANRQMVLAESEYARAVTDFHPVDHILSVEVMTTPAYVADYTTQANRVNITVNKAFAKQRQKAIRRSNVYCVGSIARVQCNIDEAEALAAVEMQNIVFRQEEMRVDAKATELYNKKLQISNIGNKIQASAISGMTSAAGMMIASLGGMSKNITSALGAAGKSLAGLTDSYNQKSMADSMVYGQQYKSQPQQAGNVSDFGSTSSSGSNQMETVRSDFNGELNNNAGRMGYDA